MNEETKQNGSSSVTAGASPAIMDYALLSWIPGFRIKFLCLK
jgi:hypothetical protein